jgi:hypothetical protein
MKLNQLKGGKSSRHVSISSKRDSVNSEFLQPGEKEQIVRTNSARKSERKILNFKENQCIFSILKLF